MISSALRRNRRAVSSAVPALLQPSIPSPHYIRNDRAYRGIYQNRGPAPRAGDDWVDKLTLRRAGRKIIINGRWDTPSPPLSESKASW